jgi:hypothetical protein
VKLDFGVFHKPDGGLQVGPLRPSLQFEGKSWIFAKTAKLKFGETVYEVSDDDWDHQNSSGTVWETADSPLARSIRTC